MYQRKVIQQLNLWKNYTKKCAVLLNGARQVGKTTCVRMFAKENYPHFVEINFLKNPDTKKAFEGTLDTRSIILSLSAMGFGPFVEGKTLVFFDEVQECSKARTAIKFLVEEFSKTLQCHTSKWYVLQRRTLKTMGLFQISIGYCWFGGYCRFFVFLCVVGFH